jgi:tRNA pseudouridine32 synthase / 23S rRNA pseudouridine746 synthase
MLPILYEDDAVLAIDKPSGISSIPERDRTIVSIVTLLEQQTARKIFVVHRLDKEVDGVMLFAKTAASHKFLNEEFFNRNVHKTYRALVHGVMSDDRGSIEKSVRQFGSGRMGVDEIKGKPSKTDFVVLKRAGPYTLVNAFPVTGRRHQIRVHLYHFGHPIVGDRMYGDAAISLRFPRLMLHAQSITFKRSDGTDLTVASAATEQFGIKAAEIMAASQ